MTDNLPCEVVKDLLPSYIDGLTSETTNELIRAHLQGCEDCRTAYERMRDPERTAEQDAQEKREIDYLKKNRKRNRTILIWSIVGALLLTAGVIGTRFFLVGSTSSNWAPMDLQVNGRELYFDAFPMDSASGISDLSFAEADGVVTVTAKFVMASPIHPGKLHGSFTAQQEIREVRIGDRIVWADGATVSAFAADLFATRHAYVGDMPANADTANALGVGTYLGPYTNELETAQEPYGWKIELALTVRESRQAQTEQDMDAFGRVLVGLIDNLDHVTFVYHVDGKANTRTVTAAEATEFFGEDIKNCGSNIRSLDRLLEKTGLNLYATRQESADEASANEVWIQIVNMSSAELEGIGVNCIADGRLVSSGYGTNADGSAIKAGESLWTSFSALDFGDSWDSAMTEVQFTVRTTEGEEYVLQDRIRIPVDPGTTRTFRLVGDRDSGFQLLQ